MKHTIRIDDEGNYWIDNTRINNKIFDEEKSDWKIVDRKDFIDHLIDWISESRNESDKQLMKEDLKMLMSWDREFIFSNINTNEYIQQDSYVPKSEFDEICEEILELNREVNK